MTDLRTAHLAVLDALSALSDALDSEMPDREALARARWKLSRASGTRRKLLAQTVYPAIERSGASGVATIAAFRREDYELSIKSTQHIATWTTIDVVLADWKGYRAASTIMRKAIRARIEREQAVLYPLLASIGEPA